MIKNQSMLCVTVDNANISIKHYPLKAWVFSRLAEAIHE